MLKRIIIALGDEIDSELVVKSGFALAEKFTAQVLLVHVIDPYLPLGYTPLVGGMFPIVNDTAISLYERELKQHERDSLERLQTYAAQAANLNITAEISQNFGNPGRIICELADNWQADTLAEPIGTIIVMGRNQKSALSEMFLGSTSNYVLHHAPCSVLVVRLPTSNDSGDEKLQPQ